MSSLPFISHRLFVAAVRPENSRPKPVRSAAHCRQDAYAPASVPVEVLREFEADASRVPKPARVQACVS